MGYRLTIALLVFIGLCKAHGQEFVQQHVPNDSISPVEPLVRLLPNGDLWMAWLSWDTRINPWGSHLHLRKIDPAGQLLATNDLLFPSEAPSLWLAGADVLPDGGLVLVGRFAWKALFVRVDAAAQLVVAKRYSTNGNERFDDVAVAADGMPTLVGSCSVGADKWPWVVRADPNGVVQAAWSDRFVGVAGMHLEIRNAADGGALLLGQHVSGNAFSDMHVLKMDSLGQVEWGRLFTGPKLWPVEAVQRSDGGWAVLAGQQVQDSITYGAPVLFPISADGTVGSNTRLWAAPVASTYQTTTSMGQLQDGSLFVCAGVNALAGSAMFTMDSTGSVAPWARSVPDSALVLRVHALPLDNGDLLLYGDRYSPAIASYSPLIARWDTAHAFPCGSGNVPVLTDSIVHGLSTMLEHILLNPVVEDFTAQLLPDTITWTVSDPCALSTRIIQSPSSEEVLVPYPNPVGERLQLAGLSRMDELLLLDAQGKMVERWTPPFPAVLELSSVPDGLYLLRATTGSVVRSARVVVVR
nr:T9SS type A sorting domain-containing protein [Flavobacteriales bacterium]